MERRKGSVVSILALQKIDTSHVKDLPQDLDDIIHGFSEWLSIASAKGGVILVLGKPTSPPYQLN